MGNSKIEPTNEIVFKDNNKNVYLIHVFTFIRNGVNEIIHHKMDKRDWTTKKPEIIENFSFCSYEVHSLHSLISNNITKIGIFNIQMTIVRSSFPNKSIIWPIDLNGGTDP